MKLKKFMNAADGHVCGGSEFQWSCYPNARYMDIADIDGVEVGNCIFNTKSQEIYEIEVNVVEDDISYRWEDSDYELARTLEANKRGIDNEVAYDDVMFTDIASEDEILDLVSKIVHKTYVHSHAPRAKPTKAGKENVCPAEVAAEKILSAPAVEQQEYSVKITTVQCLDVRADSMEEALEKAKEFTATMRPAETYPKGVSWIDQYATKEEISRNLVVEVFSE